jgi:hypothetical protein
MIKADKSMERVQLRLAKWLFKRLGYKIVAIKQTPITNRYGEKVAKHNVYTEIPTLFIEGDKELIRYVDVTGYVSKKEPLRREYNIAKEQGPIQKLPAEVVADITLTTKPFPEEIKKQNETID